MFLKRSWKIILGTFLVYGLLVAPHEGEFWPFSIYQMFSSAGNPWSRVVVRSVDANAPVDWSTFPRDALPGTPYALEPAGVDALDVAALVTRTDAWDAGRRALLRQTLDPTGTSDAPALLVIQARGTPGPDSVRVAYTPVALVRPDTVVVGPAAPVTRRSDPPQ